MNLNLCSPPKLQRTVHIQWGLDAASVSPLLVITPPSTCLKSGNVKLNLQLLSNHGNEASASHTGLLSHTQAKKVGMASARTMKDGELSTGESISDIEGLLLDGAIDNLLSLPQEVSKVAEMQKGQSSEIQKQELYLHSLQSQLNAEKEKCDGVFAEISSVTRKLFLIEEQTVEEKNQIVQHEKEIANLIHQHSQLKCDIEHQKEEHEQETKKHELYDIKMECHRQLVFDFERTLPVQQKLIQVEKRLSDLSRKKQALCLGSQLICTDSTSEELAEHIKFLKTEVKNMESPLNEVKQKVNDNTKTDWIAFQQGAVPLKYVPLLGLVNKRHIKFSQHFVLVVLRYALSGHKVHQVKEQQTKVEVATSVLNKRNMAQLTRLKRQVKEQQLRHRQWSDQHEQLLKTVEELIDRLKK